MTYEEKSAIVIQQLRSDRDRLQDAVNKIRIEIKENADRLTDSLYGDGLRHALEIIDKYTIIDSRNLDESIKEIEEDYGKE